MAIQFVYEESIVKKHDIPPMSMAGFEGLFGFYILSLLLIPLSFIPNVDGFEDFNSQGTMEDPLDAFVKLNNHMMIFVPIVVAMVSTAAYVYSGIAITKELSAMTRMVLETLRIIIVWLFALMLGWTTFGWIHVSEIFLSCNYFA